MSARALLRHGLLAAALMAAAGPAHAQSKTGTTLGAFLLIEPSARIAGMGNAGVTMYDDGLDAAYYNPAAIGSLSRWAVQFSHSDWLAGLSYDYAAAAMPLGGWGNLFGSVTSLRSGDMPVRTVTQPLGTGESFSVEDIALALGYGRQVTPRFAAGGQVTYLQETIWHSSAGAVAFNVGTLYRISKKGLHIGSSISNFGTHGSYAGRDLGITYDADPTVYGDNGAVPATLAAGEFPLPILFRVGAGMPFTLTDELTLRAVLDAYHPADNTESMSGGLELALRDAAALRAGYQNAFQQDSETSWTFGGGFRGRVQDWDYHLDYAWADHGRLGSAHRLSIGVQF